MLRHIGYTFAGLFAVVCFVVVVGFILATMDFLMSGGWRYVLYAGLIAANVFILNRIGKRVYAHLYAINC